MSDDGVLVEAVWRGETEAFASLVRKYQAPLVAAAFQLTRHAEDARDLTQEALLEAYRRLGQLRDPEKFRSWLFTILRHKCLRYLRQHRWDELPLDACREMPALPQGVADEELTDMLTCLPLADREVLAARYLYELDYEEVAQVLGINITAVYMRCKRAKERLRTLLLQADDEETGRRLRRVTSALTIGLTGDAFVQRVVQQVQPMELTGPHPSRLPKPLTGLLHGVPAWLPAIGGKIAAMALIACVLGGSSSAPHSGTALPARGKSASTSTPQVSIPATLAGHLSAIPPLYHPLKEVVNEGKHAEARSNERMVSMASDPRAIASTAQPCQPVQTPVPMPVLPEPAPTPAPEPVPVPLLLADAGTPGGAPPSTAVQQRPSTATVPAAAPASSALAAMALQFGNTNRVRMLAVSPDGTRLATLGADNAALIWDLATGTLRDRVPDIRSETNTITFSTDSRQLLIPGDAAHAPLAWDLAASRSIPLPDTLAGEGRFTVDGREYWQYQLVEQDNDNYLKSRYTLKLWDLAGGRVERTVPGLYGELLDISRDNTRAVTLTGTPKRIGRAIMGTNEAEFIVWDLTTGKEITRLKGLGGFMSPGAALFSPDGKKFAAAGVTFGNPPDILVWDTHTGALLLSLNKPIFDGMQMQPPHKESVLSLAFSADGTMLASGGDDLGRGGDHQAVVWDIAAGTIRGTLRQDNMDIVALAFTPDGSQVVTAASTQGIGGAVQLWQVRTGKLIRSFTGAVRQLDIRTFAVSADGKLLATGGNDQIAIWDLPCGSVRSILPLPAHAFPCSMDFSPDGTLLLAALRNNDREGNGTLYVWNTVTGILKKTITAHPKIITRVTFSRDGFYAASCSEDKSVVLWSTSDWTEIKRLSDNPGIVVDLAFSPDGMKLAWLCLLSKRAGTSTTANGGRLTVWDIPSGQRDTLDTGEGGFCRHLLFSPDGKWLAIECTNIFSSPKNNRAETILWNVPAAKEEKRLAGPPDIDWCCASAFTTDSSTLLGSTRDGLAAWNIPTGEEKLLDATAVPLAPDYQFTRQDILRVINANLFMDSFPPGVLFTHHDTLLLTNDWSGTMRISKCRHLLPTPDLQPVATCYTFDNGGWLIVTPQGYFDGSPEIAKAIVWKQNGQLHPYAQFEQQYHRPELVRKALVEEPGQ